MNAVLAIFREVRDPRAPNARHPLASILMLAFCATLCGCKNCVEFAEFCEDSQDTLAEFIDLPHGTPSHDCFSRTLRLLDPAELQRALLRILAGLREGLALPAAPSGVVAVDGKRLKRAYEHGRAFAPPLMVSVWDTQTRLSLAAVPAPSRNEVAGVLSALASLDLTGCVVTADALHCHPAMACTVQAHGADYALCIKGNHGPLRTFTEHAFAQAEVDGHPPFSEHQDQGHGRREWRCASIIPVPEGAPDFPGLTALGRIEAEREIGGKRERSTRYVALSQVMAPDHLLAVIRSHWDVENGLHWPLDVVFHEDMARSRKDHAPANLAILRRLALDVLRAHPDAVTIKRKMRRAISDQAYLYSIFAYMR